MDKNELKNMFWDYHFDYTGEDIYRFLLGEKEIKELNRNRTIARMLSTMRWYDMVDLFGLKQLYGFLNDDVLNFLWKKSMRKRYRNVRKTLHGILQ